jgi:hypothetical protein
MFADFVPTVAINLLNMVKYRFRSQAASVKGCLVADEQGLCLGGKYMRVNEIAYFLCFFPKPDLIVVPN